MRKKIAVCILALVVSYASGFLTSSQQAYLSNLIQTQVLTPNRTPGVGLSIVKKNSTEFLSFNQGYGFSDLEAQLPVFTDSKFLIASISKSFTATIACKVLGETFPDLGESVLDVPIVKLVPSFNFTLSDRFRTETTTFRDLLSHRTCLNSYGLGVTAGAFATKQERVYRFRYIGEKCSFRTRYEYSNNMLILAGEIISHITGTPFDDMVRNLLQSIGMNDSSIVDVETDYENLHRMSRGYYLSPDGILRKMNASTYNGNSGAAAGGIISTLADMNKYMEFHLNDGIIKGQQIVPKSVIHWLRKPSNLLDFTGWRTLDDNGRDNSDGNIAYGLALDIGIYQGWQRVGHDGDLSPFTSTMTLYPALELGVLSFSNGPGPLPESSGHHFIRNEVFDLLQMMVEGSDVITESTSKMVTGQKAPPRLQRYASSKVADPETFIGVYGHPYEGIFEITNNMQNTSHPLRIQYGKRGSGFLEKTENDNIFKINWFGDILSILFAYNGGQPLSDMSLDFSTPNVVVYTDSDGQLEYKRNATLDTLPTIPWDPYSCGPSNIFVF